MDEEQALAICIAGVKGYKDKDLLPMAEAMQYLRGLPKYSSNVKIGKAIGTSGEIVREFLCLFRLPENIQTLFKIGQLNRLEQVRRLYQLSRKYPGLLDEAASILSMVTAWDGRQIIDYLIKNPGVNVSEAKKAVLDSKQVIEKEYHVIAILSENDYLAFKNESQKYQTSVDKLVTSIVHDWLKERGHCV